MSPSNYNQWYILTYDRIRDAVTWSHVEADLPIKLALIFSWMPCVIMNSRRGVSLEELETTVRSLRDDFAALPTKPLWLIRKLDPSKKSIRSIFDSLEERIGGVATSKFLHFSRQTLFPMFDREIKNVQTGLGYFRFMEETRKNLQRKQNLKIARRNYARNPLRGWDIYLMKRR